MNWLDSGYVRAFASVTPDRYDYDVVWASYGPRYMVDAGIRVARAHPEASLVMDLRDPVVRHWGTETPTERREQEKRESRIARYAEGITTVGEGLLFDPEVRGLPRLVAVNGIEPNWKNLSVSPAPRQTRNALQLYYGGRLYPTQRLDSLIQACAQLSLNEPVLVHYAGRQGEEFRAAFQSHGLGDLVIDHGYVTRAESKDLLAQVDAAILLSWNTQETDVLTGKVYELIASNKPIVCLVNGEHQTSALFRLFEGDAIRRVFPAANDSATAAEIARFLSAASRRAPDVIAKFDGRTRYQEYSYEFLSKQLSSFFADVIARRGPRSGQAESR